MALKSEFDVKKVYLLNLFYCAGEEKNKLAMLYDIIVDGNKAIKHPNDERLIHPIEQMIMIPTVILAYLMEKLGSKEDDIYYSQKLIEELSRVLRLIKESV